LPIYLYFDQNILPTEITSIIRCSIQTVCNTLQLHQETNNATEREGHGRSSLNNTKQLRGRMIENFKFYQNMSFIYF
jgi:hypothetical protein